MGVTAQRQIETGVRGVPIGFRRMRQEDGGGVGRNVLGGLVEVVHLEIVRIVDAGQVNGRAAPFQTDRFIEQQSDTQRFDGRDHADGVVVAQDGVDRVVQMRPHLGQRFEGGFVGAISLGPEVASHDADIIIHLLQAFDQGGGIRFVHVQMQIAEVEQGEAIEGGGQPGNDDLVAVDANVGGIAQAPAVQTQTTQGQPDHGMNRVPILDVEKRPTPAKDLGGVIGFDAEPLL